jgi:hypothetical protein
MTKEEFRARLMSQVSPEKSIDSLVTGIIRLMMTYHESDPRFFLEMPTTTFDVLVEETIKITKEDAKSYQNPTRRGATLG